MFYSSSTLASSRGACLTRYVSNEDSGFSVADFMPSFDLPNDELTIHPSSTFLAGSSGAFFNFNDSACDCTEVQGTYLVDKEREARHCWNMRLPQLALYILMVSVSACGTQTTNLDHESPFTNVTVHECSEADTCIISLSDPIPPIFGHYIPIRLKGIHAWAIKGRCLKETELAKEARDFLRAQLDKAVRVDVLEPERDKYFRLYGYLIVDGTNLSTALIAAGHAQPDRVGTKPPSPCPGHTPLNCSLQCR